MTIVRRILIALTTLALMANAAALVLIKTQAGPAPSDEKSKIVFWVDDKGQAQTASEKLKALGYGVELKKAEREDFVDANYRVVMNDDNKQTLTSVANILRKSGHQNLTLSKEGNKLFYGGTFTQKSEANRVAKSLEAKERFIFEVESGKKKVKKSSNRVIVMDVPRNFVSDLEGALREASVDSAKTEETPINWSSNGAGSEE